MTPRVVAAGTSTLSRPTPARPTILRLLAASRTSSSTVVADRTRRASASPTTPSSSSRFGPSTQRTSTPSPNASTVDGASLSAIKTTGFDMFFDPYGNWSDQWLVISGGSSIQVTEVTVQRELGGAPMTLEQSKTTMPGFLYDSADVREFQQCLILSVNRLVSPNWGPSATKGPSASPETKAIWALEARWSPVVIIHTSPPHALSLAIDATDEPGVPIMTGHMPESRRDCAGIGSTSHSSLRYSGSQAALSSVKSLDSRDAIAWVISCGVPTTWLVN